MKKEHAVRATGEALRQAAQQATSGGSRSGSLPRTSMLCLRKCRSFPQQTALVRLNSNCQLVRRCGSPKVVPSIIQNRQQMSIICSVEFEIQPPLRAAPASKSIAHVASLRSIHRWSPFGPGAVRPRPRPFRVVSCLLSRGKSAQELSGRIRL